MEDEINQKAIKIDNIINTITNKIETKVKQLYSIELDLNAKKKSALKEFNDVEDIKLSNDQNELRLHNEKLIEEEKRLRIIIDNYNKNKIKVDEDINIYNLKETRNISRVLFNIKFLQIKLLNEEGKK